MSGVRGAPQRMQGPYTIHVAKKPQHVEGASDPDAGEPFTRCGLTWPPEKWPDNHAWVDPGGPVGSRDKRCETCWAEPRFVGQRLLPPETKS